MRSHILWILILQAIVIVVLVIYFKPPGENEVNQIALEASKEAQEIYDDYLREFRVLRMQTGNPQPSVVPANHPARKEFVAALEIEQENLKRLIATNPEKLEYQFRLAKSLLLQDQREQADAILRKIAPVDKPGFAEAHLHVGRELLNQPGVTAIELRENEDLSLVHLDHCLSLEPENKEANTVKAGLLLKNGNLVEAYRIYESLFVEAPEFYKQLTSINKRQDQAEKNPSIFAIAAKKLRQQTKDNADDISAWVAGWQHYLNCLIQLQDFKTAESELTNEIKQQQTELANRKFIEKLLARVYTNWAMSEGGREGDQTQQSEQLRLLSKSMEYDNRDAETLRWLAFLGTSPHEEISTQAIKIYDAKNDPNAPGVVCSEIGAFALAKKDHIGAIEYFEKARQKAPRDPAVLNNLAFAYLQAKKTNPERALLLVDQALSFITADGDQQQAQYQSNFLHTRDMALQQLGRNADAKIGFVMQDRPDKEKILRALLAIYEGRDPQRAEEIRKRLSKIQADKKTPVRN